MKNLNKMNNKGSALIIVIIVITFVGVLATVVLTMTGINAQTKRVDTTSKKTFYDAESALDEVTLGIENVLAESTNKAYSAIFTEFTTLSNEERNSKFQDEIMNEVEARLKFSETVKDANGKQPIVHLLQGYITNSSAEVVSVGSCSHFVSSTQKYLKINAIKIVYNDGDYSNTITTDIRINVPKADLSASIPKTSTLSFENYGLICENQLFVDGKKLTVNGDIYAGYNGININGANSSAAFISDNIISKGDILVSNTYLDSASPDKVNLSTASTSKSTRTNIWAKNIIVKNTTSTALEVLRDKKNNTDINFANASIKVRDDLELHSPGSRVVLTGEYFGFGNNEFVEAESSAIVLNGRNSYLDLRGLSSLQLAGRSFIKVPTKSGLDDEQKYEGYAMGESITIRGNQIAYLVPSDCISLKHNPVTWEEYKNTANPITIDFKKVNRDGFVLEDYLNDGTGYKVNIYKKPSGGHVVYYYLDIKPSMLTQFYEDYCKTFGTSRMADIFDVKGLKTNTATLDDGTVSEIGNIAAVGTIVSEYVNSGTINDMFVYNPGAGGIGVTAVGLQNAFDYWTSYLRSEEDEGMTAAGYSKDKGVVENLINVDLINEINSVNGANDYIFQMTDVDGSKYSVLIVDNYDKFVLNVPSNMKGVVIATGDVKLDFQGGSFTGLIVAGCKEMKNSSIKQNGVITVSSSSTVIADEKIVKTVLGNTNVFSLTYKYDGEYKTVTLADFFNEPSASSVGFTPEIEEEEEQFQSLSGMVVYENWTKE